MTGASLHDVGLQYRLEVLSLPILRSQRKYLLQFLRERHGDIVPALLVPGRPSPATTTAMLSVISLWNRATIA